MGDEALGRTVGSGRAVGSRTEDDDPVNGAEAARLKDFCLKHNVRRDVNDQVVGRVVVVLKFNGHALGGLQNVRNRLK